MIKRTELRMSSVITWIFNLCTVKSKSEYLSKEVRNHFILVGFYISKIGSSAVSSACQCLRYTGMSHPIKMQCSCPPPTFSEIRT